MGYPSNSAQIVEGNVDDGHSSAMYDAQFKPSSSNLPPLGATLLQTANSQLLSTAYQNTTYDQFGRPIGAISPTAPYASGFTTVVMPKTTTPMTNPVAPTSSGGTVAVVPYGTGTVTGVVATKPIIPPIISDGTPFPNPGGVISPNAPANQGTQQAAQNNADTLNQQAAQAAANGNSALAKALAAQAANWNGIANAIRGSNDGKVVNPLSGDVVASDGGMGSNTDSTLSTVPLGKNTNKAGLLGNTEPKYLLAAAALALFLLSGK